MEKRTYTRKQMDRRNETARAWRAKRRDYMRVQYRRYDLKYAYGLNPEEYTAIFNCQGGVCAICGTPPKNDKKGRLAVDHDHKSERNRGLLCTMCNHALERIENDPDWGIKALNYLALYIEQTVKV